jgi:hypothetical protein
MNTLAFLAIVLLAGFLAFHCSPAGNRARLGMQQKAAAQAKEAQNQPPVGVQVIEFSDMTDLLIKLRRVRAGQDIDIRQVGPDIIVTATGIRCGDTAAMAAFMEKVSKEHEFLSREIQREINRINRMP